MNDPFSSINRGMQEVQVIAQRKNNPAGYMHKRMLALLAEFQANMPEDMELGIHVVGGAAPAFHLRGVGFSDPDMIVFHGLDSEGNRTLLMQHYSQMGVVAVAVPPLVEEPYRVGFTA